MVAGRAAYGLVLTPRTGDTLVGSVHLSIDARTSLPLAVTVVPRGATTPAVDVRFRSLTLGAPPARVFAFTPPPGAAVTTPTPPARTTAPGPGPATRPAAPTVTGSGWTAVAVGGLPTSLTSTGSSRSGPLALVDSLLPSVSGSWGSGHLLSTRLLTAVLTADRRYAVGAVPAATLYRALGR